MPKIKCVVVGDGYVGKTSLLVSYTTRRPPPHYVPTVFDSYALTVTAGTEPYTVVLFDTAGQEEYDRLRPLGYLETDVFLVCFSVVSPASFENVRVKWVPEVRHHCPRTPILLVGTKVDLREETEIMGRTSRQRQQQQQQQQHRKSISHKMGEESAKNLGAVKYVECSAVERKGVRAVFDEAILAALEPYREPVKTSQCLLY